MGSLLNVGVECVDIELILIHLQAIIWYSCISQQHTDPSAIETPLETVSSLIAHYNKYLASTDPDLAGMAIVGGGLV